MGNGAVQIYYGEGHGKTNVAIGSAICAACDGKQAVVIQFLKGKKEPEFLKKLEPEVKFFNFSRAGILFEQLDERRASSPIALILLVSLSKATTEGSFNTTPFPFI